jgi:hypothetical protein
MPPTTVVAPIRKRRFFLSTLPYSAMTLEALRGENCKPRDYK